jgi:hypothetical protein
MEQVFGLVDFVRLACDLCSPFAYLEEKKSSAVVFTAPSVHSRIEDYHQHVK